MIQSETIQKRFIRPAIFEAFPNLVAAQSTRLHGKSAPPFESLNLGLYTRDDPARVTENRALFFADLGFTEEQTAGSHQVHDTKIQTVEEAGQSKGYDALITNRRGILLTVTVADCTPILVYDAGQQAIAAIHAGWRGTVSQIVSKTLQKMQSVYGTQASDCHVYIGTCIDACDYEVDADVADHFPTAFKQWDADRSKYMLDLKAANRQQLLDFGIPEAQIEVAPYSTCRDNQWFFSHRKEKGQTGRMLGAIGMDYSPS